MFLAVTANVANVATVIAVPRAIANTDMMPPKYSPLRMAKVRTINAPEQGRSPTASTADEAVFHEKSLAINCGSGTCA